MWHGLASTVFYNNNLHFARRNSDTCLNSYALFSQREKKKRDSLNCPCISLFLIGVLESDASLIALLAYFASIIALVIY